jgi:hypothetical protein
MLRAHDVDNQLVYSYAHHECLKNHKIMESIADKEEEWKNILQVQ